MMTTHVALALLLGTVLAPPPAPPDTEPRADTAARSSADDLARLDHALVRGDIRGASRAWQDAYRAAVAARQWAALIAVGDGAIRIGAVDGDAVEARRRARRAYLRALFIARQQHALPGVLVTVDAFTRLGDVEVAERALDVAEEMVARGERSR